MNDLLKTAIPYIATALGGPLAGAAAKFVTDKLGIPADTVENVKNILIGMPPEKLAELKEHDQEFQLQLAKLGYDDLAKVDECNVRAMEAVNKTMQAESTSEHWAQWFWRPFIGMAVGFNLICSSIITFYAYLFKPELVPQIPAMLTAQAGLNAVALPILGIASYFRGKMKVEAITADNKG